MTQQELNQQIARQTGESIREVARRGFTMLCPIQTVAENDCVEDAPGDQCSGLDSPGRTWSQRDLCRALSSTTDTME